MAKFEDIYNFQKYLEKISNDISGDKCIAQLYIDYDSIFSNLDQFNSIFNSSFDKSSTKDDIDSFLYDAYTDILHETILTVYSNSKTKFNDKFNPYAKVE